VVPDNNIYRPQQEFLIYLSQQLWPQVKGKQELIIHCKKLQKQLKQPYLCLNFRKRGPSHMRFQRRRNMLNRANIF